MSPARFFCLGVSVPRWWHDRPGTVSRPCRRARTQTARDRECPPGSRKSPRRQAQATRSVLLMPSRLRRLGILDNAPRSASNCSSPATPPHQCLAPKKRRRRGKVVPILHGCTVDLGRYATCVNQRPRNEGERIASDVGFPGRFVRNTARPRKRDAHRRESAVAKSRYADCPIRSGSKHFAALSASN